MVPGGTRGTQNRTGVSFNRGHDMLSLPLAGPRLAEPQAGLPSDRGPGADRAAARGLPLGHEEPQRARRQAGAQDAGGALQPHARPVPVPAHTLHAPFIPPFFLVPACASLHSSRHRVKPGPMRALKSGLWATARRKGGLKCRPAQTYPLLSRLGLCGSCILNPTESSPGHPIAAARSA